MLTLYLDADDWEIPTVDDSVAIGTIDYSFEPAHDHPEFVACFFDAIRQGNFEALKELLTTRMNNIDVLDEKGMTGLSIAVQHHHTNITELLLRNGAKPNLVAPGQKSPLAYAAFHLDYDTVELLLNYSANPDQLLQGANNIFYPYQNSSLLNFAISKDDTKLFNLLLKYGASLYNNPDHSGRNPFDKVAYLGSAKITKELFKVLDDNAKVKFILAAIIDYNIGALKMALAQVSDNVKQKVFHSTIKGVKPLVHVTNDDRSAFFQVLLEHGHELLEKDNAEDSPELQAAKQIHKQTLLYKVEQKRWRTVLQPYLEKIKEFEETPSLVEMAANRAHRCADEAHKVFNDLGLPPELAEVYHKAPIKFDNRSKHLKPPHVKAFLQEAFTMTTEEIAHVKKSTKRMKQRIKRAKK